MDINLYGYIQPVYSWVTLQDNTVVKSTGLGLWLCHSYQLCNTVKAFLCLSFVIYKMRIIVSHRIILRFTLIHTHKALRTVSGTHQVLNNGLAASIIIIMIMIIMITELHITGSKICSISLCQTAVEKNFSSSVSLLRFQNQ